MADREIRAQFRVQLNQSEARRVRQALDDIKVGSKDAGKSFNDMGALARAGVTMVRQQFSLAETMTDEVARGVEDLRRELLRAADAEDALAKAAIERGQAQQRANKQRSSAGSGVDRNETARQATGDISTTFGSLAGLAGGSGAVGQTLGMIGDIAGVIEYLPLFAKGLKEVAVAGPIAAVGIAAIAIAANEYNKTTAGARAALQAALAAQENYYDALQNMTTEQVEEEVRTLERMRDVKRQQIAETQGAFDSMLAQVIEATGGQTTAEAFIATDETARALHERLKTLQTEFETNEQTIVRLNQGLGANAFAANDAAAATAEATAAEEALANARRDAVLAAGQDARGDAEEDIRWREMTGEQIRAEIEARQHLIKAANAELEVLIESGDQSEETRKRIDELNKEIAEASADSERLINNYLRQADAVDELTAAQEAAQEFVSESISGIVEAAQQAGEQLEEFQSLSKKVADAQQAVNQTTADYQAALGRINSDLIEKSAEAQRELNDTLAENARTAEMERSEAIRDAQRERVKEETRHQQALAAIRRRFDTAYETAVFERDELAALQARQQRDDELAEEKSEHETRMAEISDNLKEQNRLIDQRLQEQNRAARKRYDEQLRAAKAAAQKAIQLEYERYQRELQARQQAYNELQAQLQQFLNAFGQAAGSAFNSILSSIGSAASSVTSTSSTSTAYSAGRSIGSAVSSAFSGLGSLFGFARGGLAPAGVPVRINEMGIESGMTASGKMAIFSEPTRVFTADQTSRMVGGNTVNVNLSGQAIAAASKAQAMRVISDFLDSVGVA